MSSQVAETRTSAKSEIVALIPALRAFARTFYANRDDADDLVQDTLLKGIDKIHLYEPGTQMKSWLFTIMRNTFYNRIRKENRERPGFAECASSRPTTAATQEWSARGREIAEAIDRLPISQREVLMLVCVLGTPYEGAAEICGCEIGTIKSRIHRARAGLLEQLGENSGETAIRLPADEASGYRSRSATSG
ncbi:MAG: sigma-70 family RNA polymerase sigma factor [Pararhizobium sp.]